MAETETQLSAPSASSGLPALRGTDAKTILQRYLSDESTKVIAGSLGVTRQALNQFLLKHVEGEWKDAQVARAIARKEAAEDAFETIEQRIQGADKDERDRLTLTLALARDKLKSAQWDLERVCKRIYGQDVTPDQLGRVSITLNIGGGSATNAVQHEGSGVILEHEK